MEKSVDCGWSWIILIAVYFNCVLTFGFLQIIGVFFIEWEEDFGVSAQTVGWSSSIAIAGFGSAGLISSVISAYVSCRWQSFFGGAVAATSLACSKWITEVIHLFLVMGFTGFGVGLAFTNGVVVLSYYFNKRLALANGIGFSGLGAGIFVLAPFARYLNDEYNWRGAMMLFGAILANICVCSAFFRMSTAEAISMAGLDTVSTSVIALKRIPSKSECENGVQGQEDTETTNYEKISELPSRPSKVTLCVDEKKDGEDKEHEMKNTNSGYEKVGNMPSRPSKVRLSVTTEKGEESETGDITKSSNTDAYDRMSRKSRSSIASSVRRHSTVFVKSYTVVLSIRYGMMCVISPVLLGLAYYAAVLYFYVNATNHKVSKTNAAFLLSVIGIVGIVGRLCCGPFLDLKIVTPFQFVSILGGIAGVSCLLGTLARSYSTLMVFAVVLGLTSSTCNVTYPLIIRTVVGINNFKKIFPVSVVVWNASALIGLPLIGHVYDTTGDYAVAFYVAGGLFLLNSVVAILDPIWIQMDTKCNTLGARQSLHGTAV